MIAEIRLYGRLLRMNLLAGLEYKGWWLMVLQTLAQCAGDLVSTFLLFHRFGGIGEWTLERIVLIYSIAVGSFGLAETLCRGFDYFPWRLLRTGDFDRLLLRPKSLYTQVAGAYFHLHRISCAVSGIGMAIWALARMGIPATPFNVAVLALAFMGGLLMYSGVFVMSSGIAVFTIQALDWIYIFTNASYQVARIPREYMPRLMYHVFTFVMPMLVISYYPASAVCGWGDPAWLGLLALPAGALFLLLSTLVWRFGVRHYKSTGS